MISIRNTMMGLALVMAGAAVANASMIESFTDVVSMTDIFSQGSTTPFSESLSFQAFDPALGNLTAVHLAAIGDFLLTFRALNFSDTLTETYSNGIATGTVEIAGPGGLDMFASASTAPFANTAGLAPQGIDIFSAPLLSGAAAADPLDLADYKGPGAFTLNFRGAPLGVTGTALIGNDLGFNAFGQAGGNVRVTYTYDSPIAPEPATLLLLGSALISIGLLAKRFRRT